MARIQFRQQKASHSDAASAQRHDLSHKSHGSSHTAILHGESATESSRAWHRAQAGAGGIALRV